MMKFSHSLAIAAVLSLAACNSADTAETAPAETTAPAADVKTVASESAYSVAPTGTYALDKNHAYIVFSYTHHGYSTPFLRWRGWDSTLNWNSEDPAQSSVSVDIKTANIDSGVDVFDEHLTADRWFNAEAFPDITFNSSSLTKTSDTQGVMTGDLTLKGITKPVTLDVTFNKAAYDGRSSSHKIGFSAKGKLNRSDYDLGGGVPSISDNVDIIVEAEYAMKGEQ